MHDVSCIEHFILLQHIIFHNWKYKSFRKRAHPICYNTLGDLTKILKGKDTFRSLNKGKKIDNLVNKESAFEGYLINNFEESRFISRKYNGCSLTNSQSEVRSRREGQYKWESSDGLQLTYVPSRERYWLIDSGLDGKSACIGHYHLLTKS